MRLRIVVSFILCTLMVGAASQSSAAACYGGLAQSSDPISGDWDVSFKVEGTTTPATFKLKLDGENVTGTANSAHTGPGTVRDGSWVNGKLSFTLDFKTHESIAISGSLKDGKLVGEFRTEGFVSSWEAKKKAAATAVQSNAAGNAAPTAVSNSADPISGDWEATLEAQGTAVPVTLKLKLDGDKVTGTSESEHLGPGTLSKGSWAANKLSFTMDSAGMSIAVSGMLKDGKLAGEFDAGALKGIWQAKKK